MIWYEYAITTGIPTIAVIIVGFILKNQIESQSTIIENYKGYIDATDWKKVQEHYENFKIPSLKEELSKLHSNEIDKYNKTIEHYEEERKFLFAAAVQFLYKTDKNFAHAYVRQFPVGDIKQSLLKVLALIYEQTPDTPNNQK